MAAVSPYFKRSMVGYITRISCFVTTIKITACIADLFNSFCEEVYAVAFFKVMQQQTT